MSTALDLPSPPPRRRPPWALYPKLISMSALLGGFFCVLALIYTATLDSLDKWHQLLDAISPLFLYVIVPASFTTVLFSVIMFWPRRRELVRQRWMQVKLVLIVATLPALHLLARGAFQAIRQEVVNGSPEGPTGLMGYFTFLVEASIVVLLVAIWVARYKPWSRA